MPPTSSSRAKPRPSYGRKAKVVATRLVHLGDDQYREDADVKKLAGTDDLYRLRAGNYRVAYRIDNGRLIILVVKVAHRRDIYRGL
jgi:mRNA interferase RelE/StbE